MGKVRDLFLPCAKKLDLAFHENVLALHRAGNAITKAPKMMVEAVRALPHNEIEAVASHIRQLTGTERREYDRPKPVKANYPSKVQTIHGNIWSFGGR